ncbi:MAG: hypothetical protein K9K67_04710 [Bacteriovoracaceae bacterium]|nr:hypothetical protein [Bacteriovoracaceae bacterium]
MKMTKFLLIFLFLFSCLEQGYAQIVDAKVKPGEVEEKADAEYDLTDEARFESQVFIHEGLSQRKMDEECAKLKDPRACSGRGKTSFLGVDSTIVQMVAKAYSIIGGMMGMQGDAFDFEVQSPTAATEGAPGTDGAPATEGTQGAEGEGGTKKNYCTLIPAAGEALAMFTQQLSQNTLNSQPVTQETPQKEMLYRAARSHDGRAKSAKIQGTVWGATTACYGAYMAAGGIVINTKVILQAAAAGFLTAFWFSEAKQQEKYSREINEIADSLPGRGDCNPHTQLNCYCAQKETMYDPVHCVPELHKKAIANESFRVPCVDKDLKPDAQCDCISREACFDTEFFSEVSAPGFVQFARSSAGNDFRNLTRGQLTNGKLSAGSGGSAAAAKKLLGDLASKADGGGSLDKSGLGVADEFEKFGVPKALARMMASQPTTGAAKQRVSGLSADLNKSRNNFNAVRKGKSSSELRFNSANGQIGHKSKGQGNNFNSVLNKFKKKGSPSNSKSVLRFAQKAERQAQITKNKDRPLFEIISRRYQVSGWRRLEIQ